MVFRSTARILLLGVGISGCATTYVITPVPQAAQGVRYLSGVPTTFAQSRGSALLVTACGLNDDGGLVFSLAAFNKGRNPVNFGIQNLGLTNERGEAVRIFSYDEMERDAKNKAAWADFAIILGGAASAAAANLNAYSTTSGTVSGPGGAARFYGRTFDPAVAQAGTSAAAAQTSLDLARVQSTLDSTLAQLKGQILQTTTIDPGQSYGGTAVTDSLSGYYPHSVALVVHWADEQACFGYVVTKGDQQAPPIPAAVATQETKLNALATSVEVAPVPCVPPPLPGANAPAPPTAAVLAASTGQTPVLAVASGGNVAAASVTPTLAAPVTRTLPAAEATPNTKPQLTFDDGTAALKREDYQAAFAAWKPLAEKGSSNAQDGMGYLYIHGYGVAEDSRLAWNWFRKSLAQGNFAGGVNLGWMYENGEGVKADGVHAYMWYALALAASSGKSSISQTDLDRVAAKLSDDEIVQGKALAESCKKSNFDNCDGEPAESAGK